MPSPIAHSLMGVALNRDNSSLRGHQWTTLAMFAFAANAPDLDFIPGLLNGDPWSVHRVATHSLGFVALASGVVYAVMRLLRRPYAGRIAQAVAMGLLSHIALDYFCGGADDGIAILWPMSAVRVSCDFRVFPGLSLHPVLGLRNLEVALIEISVMMILMQTSAFHRLARLASRKGLVRRSTDTAKPAALGAAVE